MEIAVDAFVCPFDLESLTGLDSEHALRLDGLLIDAEPHGCAGNHHVMRVSQCCGEVRVSHFNGRFIVVVSELMLTTQECSWVHRARGGNANA